MIPSAGTYVILSDGPSGILSAAKNLGVDQAPWFPLGSARPERTTAPAGAAATVEHEGQTP